MGNRDHLILRLIWRIRSTLCSKVSPVLYFLGRLCPTSVARLYLVYEDDVLYLFVYVVYLGGD